MKQLLLLASFFVVFSGAIAQENVYPGNYELAARFSPEKMKKMVFSTSVSPHWLKKSDRFCYEYGTRDGKNWYIVDPARKTKTTLFDKDKLAM